MRNWKLPVYATLAYILAGAGWIIAGHFLAGALYENVPAARFELVKGLTYVGITATVLFVALTYLDRPAAAPTVIGNLDSAFEQSLKRGDFIARRLPMLVVFVCLATVLILALGLWKIREHALQAGENSALALKKAHAAQISSTFDIINMTLREIDHEISHMGSTHPDLQSRVTILASLVNSIAITDASGRIIHNTSIDPRTISPDLPTHDFFLHHLRNPHSELHLSAPLRHSASGRWLLIASRAIRSPSGKFMGIALAVIDPVLFGAYSGYTRTADTTISIYQADGLLLLRSPYREDAIGRARLRDLPPLDHDSDGTEQQSFRAPSLIDGKDRVYGVGTVPGYSQLRLAVGISQKELLKSWNAFALVSLSVYLLIVSGLTGLTFALLQQMRERLVLQRKATELARYPLQNLNPVLTVTSAGRRLFMNNSARQLFDSVHDDDAAQLDREIRAMTAEINPGIREFPIGARIISASFVPHAPDHCDIYLTDVTSVRQDENLLQLFFSLPFIGMAITSPETKRWLRFNDRLCEILGYPRAELERKSWPELTHPDDLAANVAEIDRVRRGETDGFAMDKRFIRPDGTVVDAAIDVHAVRRPDRTIEFLVATIQDITERKQAEHRLREQRDLYAALSATNEAIIRIRDRNILFQRVCEIAVERTGITFAWLGMLDNAKKLRPVVRAGEDQGILEQAMNSMGLEKPDDCAAAARSLANNRIEIVNDLKDDPGLSSWLELFGKAGFQSLAVLPVRQNGDPIATLHLYSREPGYFRTDIVALLTEMGADLDYALDSLQAQAERDRAVAELQHAETRWQFALEGGEHGVWEWNAQTNEVYFSPGWKNMLGYTNIEIPNAYREWQSRIHPDDLEATLRELAHYSNGKIAHFSCEYRLRCKDGSYKWILARGKSITRSDDGKPLQVIGTQTDITARKQTETALRDSEQKFKTLVEQSLIGIYMVDNRNMLYANPRTEEIFGYAPGEMNGIAVHALVAPEDRNTVDGNIRRRTSGDVDSLRYEFRALRKDGKVIDVGVHGSRTNLAGKPVVLGVLQDITDKQLHEKQINEYLARLERSIISTIEAISHMVDLRDPYTSGHERRVGELAAAIGAEIGLSEHQVTGLRVAGGVHDVGKIAVPAEILSKPTRLSAPEFAIVKTHAQQGYEILKDIEFPWPVAITVWQHHERLDGSGYPQGLRGDEICLEARIMAVADVVESMSTHRPYRPALGIEAAIAELQDKAGTLYDPAIVAACVRLFHDKGYKFTE